MGMTLLGYYQATQRLDEEEGLSAVGQKIIASLSGKFKDAFALVVGVPLFSIALVSERYFQIDSAAIATTTTPPLIPYLSASGSTNFTRASFSPTFTLAESDSPERALAVVRRDPRITKFGDFDDHLENVSVDWLRGGIWGDEFTG